MASTVNILGKRIRQLREERGLTQGRVADHLKISRSSVVQMESGGRNILAKELLAIAHLFRVTCEEILNPKQGEQVDVVLSGNTLSRKQAPSRIRINVPQENVDKFRHVLLYILNEVGSKPNVGETVIYKLLYFIDFNYYERYEEQLIGATYIKNHFGPTPVEYKKIVESMIEREEIVKVSSRFFKYPQTKYLPLIKPDLSLLNAQELDVIDTVLNTLSDMTASQISQYSHKDVPWISAEEGKPIEYESVFYRTIEYSVREYDDEEE